VALKSFVIENGRVRYRDLKSGRELILDKINQTVSLDLDQKLEDVNTKGKLEISEIRSRIRPRACARAISRLPSVTIST